VTRFASLDELKRHLLATGQNLVGEPSGFMLNRRFDGRLNIVRVTWGMPPGTLHFFTVLRLPLTPEKRGAVLELLNDFNKDALPGFHLADHVVYATYTFLDEGGGVSESAVQRCLDLCARAVTERLPVLQKALE
jgi:hypothetical protein